MNSSVIDIPVQNFAYLLLLVIPVLYILYRWKLDIGKSLYALARMLFQLISIGFVLAFIFEAQNATIVLFVLSVMIIAAAWISLNPLNKATLPLYFSAFLAIFISGTFVLAIVVFGVLQISPWYSPRVMIPLAGMIYSVGMTAVSLSGERMLAELKQGTEMISARSIAFSASLIPTLNSLFAVGLVTLPGMMTGQILSGVAPMIAVKYQVVVMVMTFGAAGLSTAIFLVLGKKHFLDMNSSLSNNS